MIRNTANDSRITPISTRLAQSIMVKEPGILTCIINGQKYNQEKANKDRVQFFFLKSTGPENK